MLLDMRFFDSHAHLTGNEEVIRAKEKGVDHILHIATDDESLDLGLKLNLLMAAALTPHDVHKNQEAFFERCSLLAKQEKLVAIGETGLDHFHYKDSSLKQKEFLEKHLSLAEETNLPLIIHCREAFQELFPCLRGCKTSVILHCFTGTLLELEEALKRDYYISYSGIITFPKANSEALIKTPLDKLLIETDSPFLAPVPFRGQKNEPMYLPIIAQKAADLKRSSLEEIALYTSNNAEKLFLNRDRKLNL